MAGLGIQDCEAYRRDGYLCPIDIFDADEAAAHRAALEGIERNCMPRSCPGLSGSICAPQAI